METKKIIALSVLSLVLLVCVSPLAALAQEKTGYNLLSPLPNIGGQTGTSDFGGYLNQMFRLAIGLAAIFAVFFMVVGGIEYMSTDAWTEKKEGMKKIKNAFWGLVLVLASWLILNTINPDILKLKLDIKPATVQIKPAETTAGNANSPTFSGATNTEEERALLNQLVANPGLYGLTADFGKNREQIDVFSGDPRKEPEKYKEFLKTCREFGMPNKNNPVNKTIMLPGGKTACVYSDI